jgi:tetratricopeptide (TPR) repeat protein
MGRWLHRKLEGYRLPRRLAGTQGEDGIVPTRLTPIFRDRDELPAAGDLSEKVRAALAASRNLIVLCSPHSAASPWVGKEIATFRELHPDRPIFTAIVDGEPGQCFSPALLEKGVEPLAADLRKEGDGRRLGLLKLVAGLAGTGLDALVQRDAARRIRRVTYVTAAAVAAMVAMALLTAFALNARAEAQRQRQEAEGMVEFMLTDLRDRLKGVNSLRVMTAVNQRALQYYQKQDLEGLPPESLERRARILHAMGEDDEKRGLVLRALAQFEEAKRTTGALLAEKPDDPQRIYDHSQSEYWVGLIAWRTRRIDSAQAAFSRYAELALRLNAIDPTNIDWLLEAGYARSNLGTLLLQERADADAAENLFRQALRIFQTALGRKPGDTGILWDLADGHAWLADAYRAQAKYPEALAERRRQAEILRRLSDQDPENAKYARGRATNALGTAQIELDSGRFEQARRRLEAAHRQGGDLAARDPENTELQLQKVATGLFLAEAIMKQRGSAARRDRQVSALLGDCSAPAVRGDKELGTFCSILNGRLKREEGGRPSGPPPARSGKLSQRWAIDFAAEQAETF